MFFIVCQQICWLKVSVLGIGKHPNETRVNSITIGMCAIKMETLEALEFNAYKNPVELTRNSITCIVSPLQDTL